jgi:HKD family nuclease
MNIKIIDNISEKLFDILTSCLQKTKDARIAVAFAKSSGINLISSALLSALEKGSYIEK